MGIRLSGRGHFGRRMFVPLLLRQADQRPVLEAGELQRRYPFGKAREGAVPGTARQGGFVSAEQVGLYDMHGNVWQWCEDLYDPNGPGAEASVRVYRGGGWFWRADQCRAGYRYGYTPDNKNFDVGFRLARVPVEGK